MCVYACIYIYRRGAPAAATLRETFAYTPVSDERKGREYPSMSPLVERKKEKEAKRGPRPSSSSPYIYIYIYVRVSVCTRPNARLFRTWVGIPFISARAQTADVRNEARSLDGDSSREGGEGRRYIYSTGT